MSTFLIIYIIIFFETFYILFKTCMAEKKSEKKFSEFLKDEKDSNINRFHVEFFELFFELMKIFELFLFLFFIEIA